MDPGEEARVRGLVEPRQRGVRDLARRPFDLVQRQPHGVAQFEVVEVVVEALGDAPLGVEHERPDEAAGAQTLVPQDLGQNDVLVAQIESAVVPDPVSRRELSGEDRRMRRQCQRRHRLRLLEQHALSRQPIHVRRLDVREPVGPDPIRPGRVQRDEQKAQIIRPDPGRKPTQCMPRRCRDLPAGQEAGRYADHQQHRLRPGPPQARSIYLDDAFFTAALSPGPVSRYSGSTAFILRGAGSRSLPRLAAIRSPSILSSSVDRPERSRLRSEHRPLGHSASASVRWDPLPGPRRPVPAAPHWPVRRTRAPTPGRAQGASWSRSATTSSLPRASGGGPSEAVGKRRPNHPFIVRRPSGAQPTAASTDLLIHSGKCERPLGPPPLAPRRRVQPAPHWPARRPAHRRWDPLHWPPAGGCNRRGRARSGSAPRFARHGRVPAASGRRRACRCSGSVRLR